VRLVRDYALGVFSKNARLPLNNVNMYTYIIVVFSSLMIFYSLAIPAQWHP